MKTKNGNPLLKFGKWKEHLPIIIGICYFGFLFIIYHGRVASFIFFDEYANYIAAYFMSHGHELYAQNFFNHQMLPVYISFLIQNLLHPTTLYSLYLDHRMFILFMSFICGSFLLIRMRWIALGFIFIFEISKYYLFGNLFLAESMIVYPLVYLFYLAWRRLQGEAIIWWDLILSAILTWFIVFSREPYIPLALFLFAIILIRRKLEKWQIVSLAFFLLLSAITLLTVPLKEYFYQAVYVSYATVFLDQIHKTQSGVVGPISILFYPFVVFFKGDWTFFRWILIGLSSVFLFCSTVYIFTIRKYKLIIFVVIALALANLRVVLPGTEFYSAFYLIQWYALFIVSISLLLAEIKKSSFKLFLPPIIVVVVVFLFIFLSPQSYLHEKLNTNQTFAMQYNMFQTNGEAMKIMAKPNSTMFVDMSDSLLYWTAGLPSSFKYGVFYPVMHDIPKYRKEKEMMFAQKPPDFYYINCTENIVRNFYSLPLQITQQYAPVNFEGNPTCFLVKKSLVRGLNQSQINEVGQLGYSFQKEFLNSH